MIHDVVQQTNKNKERKKDTRGGVYVNILFSSRSSQVNIKCQIEKKKKKESVVGPHGEIIEGAYKIY